MKEELEDLAELSDVNHLGCTVLLLFSYTNYITAIYGDTGISAANLQVKYLMKETLGTLYPCV
jgi:hypothetical protein